MHKLHAISLISLIRLRDILCSARTAVVAIMIGIFVYTAVEPFAQFARDANVPLTPFLVPMLIDDQICQLFLLFGAMALFSSAPFKDDFYPYLAARAGKTEIVFGNALGLLMVSVLYVLFIYIISILPGIDILVIEQKWGKVITTLAAYPADGFYFTPSEAIRVSYQPLNAMLTGGILEISCVFLLGLFVYSGNLLSNRPVGLWLAGTIVVLDITIYNYLPDYVNAYSPAALARLSTYTATYMPLSGSVSYGFLFIGSLSLGLLFLIWIIEGIRKDIA